MDNKILVQDIPLNIAIAWSGGADSTALFFMLLDLGFDVQLWHVDHGWHHESAKLTQDLAKKAQGWGVRFHSKRLEKPFHNLEAESRKGRYSAFAELAEETGCFHVALGHHADDQAETVCMRLLQGAGVAGCRGMHRYRQQGDMHFWRPLLHVSRQNIEKYLLDRDEAWVNDPSNEDIQLWRNKIRHQLIPTMHSYGVDAHRLFLRWQHEAVRLHSRIEKLATGLKVEKWYENRVAVCEINWVQWCEQPEPIRVYMLQKMMGTLFTNGSVFGRRHIMAIEDWRKHGGHSWLNLSGCCLYRAGQGLQLCQGKVSLRMDSRNASHKDVIINE